jgi:hypothetical protein
MTESTNKTNNVRVRSQELKDCGFMYCDLSISIKGEKLRTLEEQHREALNNLWVKTKNPRWVALLILWAWINVLCCFEELQSNKSSFGRPI